MKRKVIQVVPSFSVGGAETLVKNYLLNIDTKQYSVEAFVTGRRLQTSIEKTLDDHEIKVSYLSELYVAREKVPSFLKRFQVAFRWRKAIKKYFAESNPVVVHCHLSVARTLIAAAKELRGVKMFYTVHSDPDKYWGNGKNKDELKAIRYFISHNNLMFVALHEDAVQKIRNYFGEDCKVHLLNNAVDIDAYVPSHEKRTRKRMELGIDQNAYVLGHVGRFLHVKNHAFLLDIFKYVHQKRPKAVLCLVGDGELREEIAEKAKRLGLSEFVLFLGNRSDVKDILSALDAFVLPSIWEGFPLTMIEAQAAKLPCYVSDSVNHEVRMTNLVNFIKLDAGAEVWAQKILDDQRPEYVEFSLSEYDIHRVVEKLIRMYGINEG